MANNTYVWCGGYTGSTGFNSGYSTSSGVWYNLTPYVMDPNSPCVGSDDPCCDPTNPACSGLTGGGLTSSIGDIWFTPYYWGTLKNWKMQITATGGGLPSYVAATTLPNAGDNVIFTGNTGFSALRNANGTIVNPYPYSCLWGGMSGDGYVASGSTGWAGQSVDQFKYGNISFFVNSSFKKDATNATWMKDFPKRSGEVGAGGNTAGNFDYTTPLKIRTAEFNVQTDVLYSDRAYQPRICLNNIANSDSSAFFGIVNAIGDTQDGKAKTAVAFLQGHWDRIEQSAGSIYGGKIEVMGPSPGYWICNNEIVKMSSSIDCGIKHYSLNLYIGNEPSYIWGMNGGNATVTFSIFDSASLLNQMNPPIVAPLTIGGFGGGTASFSLVSCDGGNTNLVLASCQIGYLYGEPGTHITVHPNLNKHDYCIIRDGYIKENSSLNMANLSNDNWKNFKLGYSPSDKGLRIDHNDATINGYVGQSLKTGFVQDNQGVTS